MKTEEEKRRAKKVRKYLTRLGIIIGIVTIVLLISLAV